MTEETENLVLQMLRGIRATLDEHTKLHADHTERFERLEKRMEDVHEGMYSALGFATHANMRTERVGERLNKLEDRVSKLEDERV